MSNEKQRILICKKKCTYLCKSEKPFMCIRYLIVLRKYGFDELGLQEDEYLAQEYCEFGRFKEIGVLNED